MADSDNKMGWLDKITDFRMGQLYLDFTPIGLDFVETSQQTGISALVAGAGSYAFDEPVMTGDFDLIAETDPGFNPSADEPIPALSADRAACSRLMAKYTWVRFANTVTAGSDRHMEWRFLVNLRKFRPLAKTIFYVTTQFFDPDKDLSGITIKLVRGATVAATYTGSVLSQVGFRTDGKTITRL